MAEENENDDISKVENTDGNIEKIEETIEEKIEVIQPVKKTIYNTRRSWYESCFYH